MEREPFFYKEVELKGEEEIKEVTEIKREIEGILSATGKNFGEKLEKNRKEKTKRPPFFIEELKKPELLEHKDWFQKLSPEKRIEMKKEIAEFMHQKAREASRNLYEQTLKKIEKELPEFKEINEKIKEIREKKKLDLKERDEEATNFLQNLSPEKQDVYIEAIYKFEKYFGSLPGAPNLFSCECVGHTTLIRQISELYGFKGMILNPKEHSFYGMKIDGEFIYSDIRFKHLLKKEEWEKEREKKYGKNIKIDEIPKTSGNNYEASLHNNFGVLLLRLKRDEKAVEEFKEALKINPKNPTAKNYLEILLAFLGKDEKNKFLAKKV